ncbi:amidohydrolase family protein [Paenibacillus koleovorans]|uniref:amidohydrolase family protein n=1 Tax=Paenibacillus koleovorans TaxID=121608 RepID=UPI000FDCCC2A|nr:amidohydrolase family protein [Paenibacillus koleovorans]
MIIDMHVLVGEARYHSVDPAKLIEQMDACGISAALISPIDREMAVDNRNGNDRVLELSRRYPGRFHAYATANPWYGQAAVDELERALTEGAAAVKLHPPLQGFTIMETLVHPLIEVAAKHRVPVYVHTGTPAFALPMQLRELALTFPEVPFIMGKNGKTDFWIDVVPAMEGVPNIYADTAHDFPERAMGRMYRMFGAERLLFSSNHPVGRMPLELDKVRDLEVSAEDKAAILGGNIQRLLQARIG